MRRSVPLLVALVTALVAALALGACGSSSSTKSGAGATTTEAGGTAGSTPASVPDCSQATSGTTVPGSDALQEVLKRGKPKVEVPSAPATQLVVKDLVVGTGATVKPCATVTVHYVGVGQPDGKQFDASWDRGQPISFPLGQVIPGWTMGIPGMKVGGRRELIIPGNLGYGPDGQPQAGIAPNETLVFVIDLINVQQ
jgi:peptidylprolyl isomerase